MPVSIISLNAMAAVLKRSFADSNMLLATIETGDGAAAEGTLCSVPMALFRRQKTISLQAMTLQVPCYPVFNPYDSRGVAHGLALSLSPPAMWRRLFLPLKPYELRITVEKGEVSVCFQRLRSGAPVRRPRANLEWVLLLSAEQKAQFSALSTDENSRPWASIPVSLYRSFLQKLTWD